MSRKSSWWLRPQRKGASNRAALNEANYFMEHNKVLRERIKELAAENAKLRELLQDYHRYEHEDCYACRYINECRADESGRCIAPVRLGERYRELGVEVDS